MTSRCTSSHLARNHQGLLSEPELARQRANDHLWLRKHRDDESSTLVRKMSRPISRPTARIYQSVQVLRDAVFDGLSNGMLGSWPRCLYRGQKFGQGRFSQKTSFLCSDSSTLPRQTADGDISAHSENLMVDPGAQRCSRRRAFQRYAWLLATVPVSRAKIRTSWCLK